MFSHRDALYVQKVAETLLRFILGLKTLQLTGSYDVMENLAPGA